jgi:hypothetical protein
MESIDESQHGYPEEAPPGSNPPGEDPPSEETPQRRGGKAEREHGDEATDTDDGTATGNPHAAG